MYVYRKQTQTNGLTLPEVLIVVGLIVVLASFVVPVAAQSLHTQTLGEAAGEIRNVLRSAHSQSFYQKHDDAHGVAFFSDSYVRIVGGSYTTRVISHDEVFTFPSNVTTTGISEVVFAKRTGAPNVHGTLTVRFGDAQRNIVIDSYGRIE